MYITTPKSKQLVKHMNFPENKCNGSTVTITNETSAWYDHQLPKQVVVCYSVTTVIQNYENSNKIRKQQFCMWRQKTSSSSLDRSTLAGNYNFDTPLDVATTRYWLHLKVCTLHQGWNTIYNINLNIRFFGWTDWIFHTDYE